MTNTTTPNATDATIALLLQHRSIRRYTDQAVADTDVAKIIAAGQAMITIAKALAYLHILHGEPSPRHSWRVAKTKRTETSKLVSSSPTATRSRSIPKKEGGETPQLERVSHSRVNITHNMLASSRLTCHARILRTRKN